MFKCSEKPDHSQDTSLRGDVLGDTLMGLEWHSSINQITQGRPVSSAAGTPALCGKLHTPMSYHAISFCLLYGSSSLCASSSCSTPVDAVTGCPSGLVLLCLVCLPCVLYNTLYKCLFVCTSSQAWHVLSSILKIFVLFPLHHPCSPDLLYGLNSG